MFTKFLLIAVVALFATAAGAHSNHTCHWHSDGTSHCK